MNILSSVLTIIIAVYGGLSVYLWFFQQNLIYYPELPSRELIATPENAGLAYESLSIETDDGLRLHGWYVPAVNPRGILLFFHGNAGNISHRLDSIRIFNELGLSTLIFDYRGYGDSEGKITEAGSYLDAEAVWHYLTVQKNISPGDIILFGRSMGGAIATHLASRHKAKGLILESSFTSVKKMARNLYPFLPTSLLTRVKYDTEVYIQEINCPVLIIHSLEDEIIPFEQGRKLYAAARAPKKFLEIRGGHNDGFIISGQRYFDGLDNFISEITGE